jgi:hypothetical protein
MASEAGRGETPRFQEVIMLQVQSVYVVAHEGQTYIFPDRQSAEGVFPETGRQVPLANVVPLGRANLTWMPSAVATVLGPLLKTVEYRQGVIRIATGDPATMKGSLQDGAVPEGAFGPFGKYYQPVTGAIKGLVADKVVMKNPLVIAADGWLKRLEAFTGRGGPTRTGRALRAMGFDGVVVVGEGTTREGKPKQVLELIVTFPAAGQM